MLSDIPFDIGFQEYAQSILTPERIIQFRRILAQRTRMITIVTEKLVDLQNVSTVIRSCEVFGIQELHIIESDGMMKVARNIARGSNQWLDIHAYPAPDNTIDKCILPLKAKGYKILAAAPPPVGIDVRNIVKSTYSFAYG